MQEIKWLIASFLLNLAKKIEPNVVESSPLLVVAGDINWIQNGTRFDCALHINKQEIAYIIGDKVTRQLTLYTNADFPANRQIVIWLANKALNRQPVVGRPVIIANMPNTKYTGTLPGETGETAGFWVSDAYMQN